LSRNGRERSPGLGYRRVLRRLSPSFEFFAIFINIGVAIESETAELYSGPVHCVIARHHDCLLLLHESAVEAGRS
jgi:hypothetical protein